MDIVQSDLPVRLWPLAAYGATSAAVIVTVALLGGRLLPDWPALAVMGAQTVAVVALVAVAGVVAPPVLGWVRRR